MNNAATYRSTCLLSHSPPLLFPLAGIYLSSNPPQIEVSSNPPKKQKNNPELTWIFVLGRAASALPPSFALYLINEVSIGVGIAIVIDIVILIGVVIGIVYVIIICIFIGIVVGILICIVIYVY